MPTGGLFVSVPDQESELFQPCRTPAHPSAPPLRYNAGTNTTIHIIIYLGPVNDPTHIR